VSITGGGITLSSGGNIKGGQTDYATGTGFFLGYSGGAYKFSVGSSTKYLRWDGSTLSVGGDIIASGNIQSGAATQDKLEPYTAGDRNLIYLYGDLHTDSLSYVKLKEVQIDRGGSLKLKWNLWAGLLYTVYSMVYRNGSPVAGTEQSTTSSLNVNIDVSGWTAGDYVQIYGKTSYTDAECHVQDFYINVANTYTPDALTL